MQAAFEGIAQHLLYCGFLSQLQFPVPAWVAHTHLQVQQVFCEVLNAPPKPREYNGAGRNLAPSPGNTSPLFYLQREGL